MIALIQIGDHTHHHDQSMTLVSFSTMKAIVSNPTNPIPPELLELDDELAILVFIFNYTVSFGCISKSFGDGSFLFFLDICLKRSEQICIILT